MGGAEVAVVQVRGDVEEQQVEEHRGARRDLPVGRELDERQQGCGVLLVVDVGVPLAQAEADLLVEPA